MELMAIVTEDQYGSLEEGVQRFYSKQQDGTYLLKVGAVNGFNLENVEGLKNSLAAARNERDSARNQLKAFEGIDVAKAREALEKVEAMRNWTPDDKVKEKIDQAVRDIKAKAETDLQAAAELADKYKGQLGELLVDHAAREALGSHELVEGGADLIMPHIRGQVKIKEVEGRLVARVVNPDGSDKVSMRQGVTDPMGVAELVEVMSKDKRFAPVWKAKHAAGSGGGSGAGGTGGGGSGSGHAVGGRSGGGEGGGGTLDPVERLSAARRAQASGAA